MIDDKISRITDCPNCKTPTMTLDAIDPGIFLGAVFARYSCRRCRRKTEASFAPPVY